MLVPTLELVVQDCRLQELFGWFQDLMLVPTLGLWNVDQVQGLQDCWLSISKLKLVIQSLSVRLQDRLAQYVGLLVSVSTLGLVFPVLVLGLQDCQLPSSRLKLVVQLGLQDC